MSKAGFVAGCATGLLVAALFSGTIALADRLKVHKDAGAWGICLYHQGDSSQCNGDVAERSVLITADEVESLVQGARNYCDTQVAKAQGEFGKALEAQKAEILKELGQPATKAAPKKTGKP